ncbi:MAG: hypothetical protein COV01_01385 [Candidatus Taylorbacteria bacterium CG10_big_fil_rev_8_21_14_0_10_41_48]|uniref:Uncharacterized protein n=1 Tax=Candidatus Taylorbacteria bacterium CG10_big_fil_rev_8_21_14_0_10_41_48 TaxID=1975024 RepID=A0A2M8LCP5_9BACT|nr:MAG: hypothetical protein COV01_01385 [Candidatus Taylorbacteria bacterium CG10_big_fil_rev_8_21_14_0_10_41_48]
MSWASSMRAKYIFGIFLFFAIVIGVPTAIWLYEPASCFDGKLNQDEFSIDRGGPCRLLDERQLIPHATLWARTFKVEDGKYSGVVYIENPNQNAGALKTPYRFKIYDENNVLVAEKEGYMFIMPGVITPFFIGNIATGERNATRAFFEFAGPIVWERLNDRSSTLVVRNKEVTNVDTMPRVTAVIGNTGVKDIEDAEVVAVAFDSAGNAFAASSTLIPLIEGGESIVVSFTWPVQFERRVARVDVLPSVVPVE